MSKGYPATVVAVLCLVSFFAGRFFQLPGLPDATGRGPSTVYKNNNGNRKSLTEIRDKSLASDTRTKRRGGLPLQDDRFEISPRLLANGNFSSFEELLEASGMLAGHPPLTPGATGHSFYTMQPMQLLSWYPRAYIFPKFMDKAKCDYVKKIAEARLSPSGLALKQGETLASTQEIRTSQGTFMGRNDDPEGVLAWIEDKIAVLTGIPAGHGEAFNILRYENGQHYDSHYDAFTEEDYGKQRSHRIATVLLYLTDVEEGGETVFLFEGKEGLKRLAGVDYKACNTGIKVKPRAGDALLFWSQNPDTSVDKHSLHGGCPVIAGNKFVATKWIRDKCIAGGTCLGGGTASVG